MGEFLKRSPAHYNRGIERGEERRLGWITPINKYKTKNKKTVKWIVLDRSHGPNPFSEKRTSAAFKTELSKSTRQSHPSFYFTCLFLFFLCPFVMHPRTDKSSTEQVDQMGIEKICVITRLKDRDRTHGVTRFFPPSYIHSHYNFLGGVWNGGNHALTRTFLSFSQCPSVVASFR